MAKKKKKNATLTGALGSYLEEKFGNKEEKKTTSKVTTDENGNVTINNSPKKEREGILVTGVKKTISGKSSIPSKILGLATNGIGEVIYNTVEAGINESKNKKVEQTVDTIKKDSDTAYNKLKDYKKENNINLFNENSKRVQNDEKYQGLLKETQEKTTTLEKERTNRNSEIIKDAVKEKSGTLSGGIIKTGTTLAGGFETGIGGIESTTKKILGQTPSLDDQEIKYNMFSDVAQNNINTTKNPVGRAGLEMTYSIGQMLPQMMTGNSAGAFTTGFANYGGSAYNQAKKDGATEEQATKYGIVSGTLEMAMEKALGGFESVYGKSVLGNSTNKLTSKVLDKFVKNKALRKTLTSMKGEFTEEYLQEFLGPIVEEALLNKDNGVGIKNTKNVKEIAKNLASYTAKNFFSTQNLYAGTLGAVTSGVMEGPQNIARNQWTKQTGRDFDTGYTQNEQKVIDEIVNKETTKKSREQAINTEIENAIKEQEQNFSISEENKNKIAERIKKEYENKDIDLSNTKLSDKEIKSIRKSVEKSLQEGTIDADEISNILGNDTDISKDDLLHRSFYEKSQKSVNYQYEENKTDSDITKALKESASKVMNNTTKSRNFVENVNKIAQERGTRYEFVNNEQLEKMGYEVKGKDINGLVGKDLQGNEKILINIDSKQALNKIVGHETTHLLEGTEEYTLLQNAVKEYAKSKGDYDHRIKSTEKLYSGLDANIENEVTSDLVGEYIFNDEEFVKKLSTSQPNVFTKIYDYVKHLYKTVTAGSQEARDLEKVKYRFEQAYKENVKGKTSEKTKYSLIGINGVENLKDSYPESYKKLTESLEEAKELDSKNIQNEKIWLKTGWFKDKNGQWKFEVSDKNMNLKDNLNIQENTEYKLSDLIEHDSLFRLYPELENLKVRFKNYASNSTNGSYNKIDDIISINNKLIGSNRNVEGTLIHEIQHKIQNIENFENGSNTKYSRLQYYNSLGEIEASNTKDRFEQEKYKNYNLDYIAPLSVDKNAKHKDLENYLNNRKLSDKIKDKTYELREKVHDKVVKEDIHQDSNRSNRLVDGRVKRTENSSFFDEKYSLSNNDENSNYKNEYSPLESKKNKTIDEKVERALQKGSYKAIQYATKTAQNYLDFDYQEKKDFRNKMESFYNMTKDDLVNANTYNSIKDIINEYANRECTYVDKEVEAVKKQIRNSKIKVTDELKNQITDYGDFRKSNFGKLRLGNEGQSIDSVYQELSNTYPYYFSSEITGEADMLTEISNFMNQDTTITEKYRVTDNDLKKITDKVFNSLLSNSITKADLNEVQKQIESKVERRTRAVVQQELLNEMGITLNDIQTGNDINAIAYQRTDPIRLNEKVFGYEIGKKINDATINQTKHNTAEKTRWLNQEREDIKKLGIKARSKESAAVQKYVEKSYINEYGEEVKYGDKELAKEFPDVKIQEKIKYASEVFRNKYDTYIDQINNVFIDLGYNPIPKRKDYMRHFTEISDKLSQWGVPFNRNDMDAENLPTDINGLTEFNRPGKNWFASSLERKGMKTTYDAVTGIDGYLEGAGNLIFHTADIQRYRTLSKFIRETYGQTHGLDNVDSLTDAEFEQRVADIQDNKLSKYVAWLDEQANALAGKKGAIDRAAERFLGRRVYTALNTLKSQVGSNMTGFNVRSALTNFASAVQGASKTSKLSFVKGTVSTINNIFHNDGLINKSDFLTARFGSDTLSQKAWQKISNAGQIFMSGSDYFTSNQIWRSKYFENLSKGMKEQEAISNADDFSARIMGDRSQGSTAELFNSKTLGFLTQFQLEVNNQWSSMIHDNKMDIESGNKSGASVVFQLGQLFGASYLFNSLMKSLTGSSVMFDPIDMLMKIFDDDDDKSLEEKFESAIGDFMDNVPMWSVFSGGRIPIQEAMTGATSLIKKLTGQTDSFGNEITWEDVGQDFLESMAYYVLPTGYGQLRKTVQGLKMYDDDLPIAGSYTDSGNLRFTADDSTTGKIKSALFGRYSSKEAQDYIDSGYKSINSSKIDEMIDLGMNSTEYRNYRNGLSKVGTKTKDKIEYINNLDVSNKKKSIMASNILKKNVDMSNYDNYGSYEEFNYAMKNPVEYKQINMITDYSNYQKIQKELSKIKSDIDKNGNAISGSRKKKVISYINSLNLSIAQKAMLIKQEYPSFTKYDKQIFNYVNGQDLTFIEKARTMKSLGFTQFDKQIIAYVKKHYPKATMQIDVLKDLGFKVYEFNGKTYVKR